MIIHTKHSFTSSGSCHHPERSSCKHWELETLICDLATIG